MATLVELNNLAVTCIGTNKLQEAVNILVQALQITRNQFYHHEGGVPNVEGAVVVSCASSSVYHGASPVMETRHPLTASSFFTPASPPRDEVSTTTIVTNTHIHCSGGSDFLNQCPFTYSATIKYWCPFFAFQDCFLTTSTSRSSRTDSLTSNAQHHIAATIEHLAVVIFNCALCHELRAQSTSSPTSRNARLARAIALYEKVVDLYLQSNMTDHGTMDEEESRTNNSSPGRTDILRAQQDMIVMAAVNNLVQLHHESSDARKNYSHLMMVLFHDVQRTDYGSEEIQRQVDLQARVFLSNTVLASHMQLELPAAAA